MGRAALDDISDIAILLPVQIDDAQHLIQQPSRRSHKGFPLQILLLTGTLAHKHHIRCPVSHAKDHMVPCVAQTAFVTVRAGFFQTIPIQHITDSFCG